MEKIELDYVHVEKVFQLTPNNLPIVEDVVEYNNKSIRNRVILRFDVIAGMTDIFTKEIISEYRDVIFNLIAGNFNDEDKASIIKDFYRVDKTFHKYISLIFYFDERMDTTPYIQIINDSLLQKYMTVTSMIDNSMHNQRCKCFMESNGYLYIAIPDEKFTLKIPGEFNEEVLSRAKVWNFDFERYKPKV